MGCQTESVEYHSSVQGWSASLLMVRVGGLKFAVEAGDPWVGRRVFRKSTRAQGSKE